MNLQNKIKLFLLIFFILLNTFILNSQTITPNIIIIFCDDMGYGDIGVFGNPSINTPHLDQMATEGQKWTNFYAAAPVCTPSRAGILTGRLPVRSGMSSEKKRVLFPDSKGGLPQSEITIAKQLKKINYKTACIGKWHLGHLPDFLPSVHGFDYYFGLPYSNDMDRVSSGNYFEALKNPKTEDFNVPLMRNNEIIEQPANQHTLTKRYTEEAVEFIKLHRNTPFFIYFAHSMPHVPLFVSEDFKGKSKRGIYGDVIEEIDWSVGMILKALKENKIEKNTLVIFTSDNGPWLTFGEHGGTAGPLRGGKGGTFDGGMREPTIFWWPDKIVPGVNFELGSTLDLFPTICKLTNSEVPNDRVYDGYDLTSTILFNKKSPRDIIFYYRDTDIFAIRKDNYKVHFYTQDEYGNNDKTIHNPPLLFDIDIDPEEKINIARNHPQIISEMIEILNEHVKTIEPVVNQLEK